MGIETATGREVEPLPRGARKSGREGNGSILRRKARWGNELMGRGKMDIGVIEKPFEKRTSEGLKEFQLNMIECSGWKMPSEEKWVSSRVNGRY